MKKLSHIIILAFSVLFANISPSQKQQSKEENILQKLLSQSRISFRENKGQLTDQTNKPRPDILFYGNDTAMNFHLRKNGISYQFRRIDTWEDEVNNMENSDFNEPKQKIPGQLTIYRLDLTWLESNPTPFAEGGESLAGCDNFYLAVCPDGVLDVRTYKTVTYKNLYPGIDLKFYEKNSQLKYDYIVSPGSDYRQIRIKVEGAESIEENSSGEIEIKTPLGNLAEGKPLVFQGGKQLNAKWKIENNIMSFEIKNADHARPFTIDPLIRNWGTYYGGDDNEGQYKTFCTSDNKGNIFIYGSTQSEYSIATSGAHQTIVSENSIGSSSIDAYLAKFSNNGNRIWSTYYGGESSEYIGSCHTDALCNVYICGATFSELAISSDNAYQKVIGSGEDAYLVKFNQDGIRQWGTYYGGEGWDDGLSCVTDNEGNVYLAGATDTWNFIPNTITTPGSHQPNNGGNRDGFLVKFDSVGNRIWGTFYGGAGSDGIGSCAIDINNDIYVAGGTDSQTNISTPGAYQFFYKDWGDAFLTKFNKDGFRQWGTYYGGSWGESANSVATDVNGNVFIAGTTRSSDGIASTNAYQDSIGGGTDNFFAKFNSTGNFIFGSYFGGSDDEERVTCCINKNGDFFLAGVTGSSSGISTLNSFKPNFSGGIIDGFLAKFFSNGAIAWSTYYGGTSQDGVHHCATDCNNNIYIVGHTLSNTGISTPGSFHSSNGGSIDNFLVQFCDTTPPVPGSIIGPSNVCVGDSTVFYSIPEGSNATWILPSGASIISGQGSNTIQVSFSASTFTGNISVFLNNDCGTGDTLVLPLIFHIDMPEAIVFPEADSICQGESITIFAAGGSSYLWSNGDTANFIIESPDTSMLYIVTVTYNYCSDIDTAKINLIPLPVFDILTTSDSICTGDSLTLMASNGVSYQWSNGAVSDSIEVSPYSDSVFSATAFDGFCSFTDLIFIKVTTKPSSNITSNDSVICNGETIMLFASGGNNYLWNTSDTTSVLLVNSINSTWYFLTAYNEYCTDVDSIFITVLPVPTINNSLSEPVSIFSGESTVLAFSISDSAQISWSPSEFLSCTDCLNPTANPSQTTTYYMTITSTNGCTVKDSVLIIVNERDNVAFLPSIFSPNSDGNNDVFRVRGANIEKGYLAVYGRWGEKVFDIKFSGSDINDNSRWWNGTFKGKLVNIGVYVYFCEVTFEDGQTKKLKGNVTLIK